MSDTRYSRIAARPNSLAEARRIDSAARKADERFNARQSCGQIMSDADAKAKAKALGLVAKRSHTCDRSRSGRAIAIRVQCEVWKVHRFWIPGLGSGDSYTNGVFGKTWEEAFRRHAIREVDRRLAREREARGS